VIIVLDDSVAVLIHDPQIEERRGFASLSGHTKPPHSLRIVDGCSTAVGLSKFDIHLPFKVSLLR
jgi:hypothetical protein